MRRPRETSTDPACHDSAQACVDLDATQEKGEVIFKNYRVGFVEDLVEG